MLRIAILFLLLTPALAPAQSVMDRLAAVEQGTAALNAKLAAVDGKLDALADRLEKLAAKMEQIRTSTPAPPTPPVTTGNYTWVRDASLGVLRPAGTGWNWDADAGQWWRYRQPVAAPQPYFAPPPMMFLPPPMMMGGMAACAPGGT